MTTEQQAQVLAALAHVSDQLDVSEVAMLELHADNARLRAEVASLRAEVASLRAEVATLRKVIAEFGPALQRELFSTLP
jgi:cell division protein FtsB